MVPEMKVERALAVAAASGALAVERREPAKLQVLTHGESVEAVVRRVALSKRADLVVIGRGHMHGGAMERIHSHAYAVICESPCPVISV
jgi:nucleotide-binding universal stress UspA family protein